MDPEYPLLNGDGVTSRRTKRLKIQLGVVSFFLLLSVSTIIVLTVFFIRLQNRVNSAQLAPPVGLPRYEQLLTDIKRMWRENRQRLMTAMQKVASPKGYVMLKGGEYVIRNGDVSEPFRQQNDFFYTTGLDIPGSWAILDYNNSSSVVFVPKFTPSDGIWYGKIKSLEELKAEYDLDDVQYVDSLNDYIHSHFDSNTMVYVLNVEEARNWSPIGRISDYPLNDTLLLSTLDSCRSIKSEKELQVMRYAATISGEAHQKLLLWTTPGLFEFQLASLFEYVCMVNGLKYQAYSPIVGTGYNSAILHYTANTAEIKPKSFVLVDAGGEFLNYATDITRTFPSDGRFTPEQRVIYQMVYNVQTKTLEKVKEGVTWMELIEFSQRTMLEELKSNGFVKGDIDEMLKNDLSRVFCPHGLGHFVGMDVHDTPAIPKTKALKAGMVITIEPGIYFNEVALELGFNNTKQAEFLVKERIDAFSQIGGVRIEDTVLVKSDGFEVLSAAVPKSIDEIETFMARH